MAKALWVFNKIVFSKGVLFEECSEPGAIISLSSTSRLVGGRFFARHKNKSIAPMSGVETRASPNGTGGFHLLAKPTGAACNLDCKYCFFLFKEMLYPGSRFRMADDLLELYIHQLLEAHRRAPEVTINWQGGEPTLMGLEGRYPRRLL